MIKSEKDAQQYMNETALVLQALSEKSEKAGIRLHAAIFSGFAAMLYGPMADMEAVGTAIQVQIEMRLAEIDIPKEEGK